MSAALRPFLVVLALLVAAGPAVAQTPDLEVVMDLAFDEPESWAMKLFGSATLLTSLGPVERRAAGDVEAGLELIQIPHLDREQRTVGFGGLKEEDLNRLPVWPRLRAVVGLPAGFGLTVGVVPPVELEGVEASLVAVGVERRLVERGPWSLGLRVYAQRGDVEGDFTCAAGADERFPPGSPENPFGCRAPSADEVTLDYEGLELVVARRVGGRGEPALHLGVAGNRFDTEFQVDALTFDFRDRTLLRTDGETLSLTLGASRGVGARSRLAAELFYSSLDVRRLPDREREDDPLLDLRVLWTVRLRGVSGR